MMNKLLLLSVAASCLVLASALSVSDEQEWEHFKQTHGKTYRNQREENYRQNVFLQNKQKIDEHNKQYSLGRTTFTVKINKFADLTNEEFRKLNGFKQGPRDPAVPEYKAPENEQLPASVDWRPKGAVTAIKDQGQCGSCWAFSTTGSLEGQQFLKKGKLVSLSEQNLMDCSYDEGNESCNGGLMTAAFDYIKKNGGIDTEKSYPYLEKDSSCKFSKANIGATIQSYTNIKEGSEADLQSAVANVGPVSVAIDAGEWSFQFYSSGIYYESSCSPSFLDHGVLAVGYGSQNGHDHWIVKNSWGSGWGLSGYILMSRNRNNNCGIASMATYPNV
uniref:Cathepsin L3 n=1 Tax=Dysdercus peruvianus TaxID=685034 RepID=A0A7U3NJE0_9HEMI|nr:cathepsin L3 [Dysdercus peruvianus]